jgi:hypothetical protein
MCHYRAGKDGNRTKLRIQVRVDHGPRANMNLARYRLLMNRRQSGTGAAQHGASQNTRIMRERERGIAEILQE